MHRKFVITGTISKLESKYSTYCPYVDKVQRAQFFESLTRAGVDSNDSHKPQDIKAFTDFWFYRFGIRLINTSSPAMHGSDIDRLISILTRHHMTREIIEDSEHEKILTGICMSHVYLLSLGGKTSAEHGLKELLTQWFGVAPPGTAVASVPDFVDYMYGPGVWQLYGTEVECMHQAPKHLYDLGLPIVGPQPVKNPQNNPDETDLPPNLL